MSGLRDSLNPASHAADAEADRMYDPRKREPQFAHASSSPLWELIPLAHHYHPAVSLHARQLLSSQPLTASADLSLNTLSHFLDRFVYKNPKKPNNTKSKGGSAMQPAASAHDGTGVKLMKGEVLNGAEAPVYDEKFWRRRPEDVPVDQLFFHKFFSQKNDKARFKSVKVDKRKGQDDSADPGSDGAIDNEELGDQDEEASNPENNSAEEDEDSDAGEAEIWKAMQASMPKAAEDIDIMEDNGSDNLLSSFDVGDEESTSNSNDENEASAYEHDRMEYSDSLSLAEGSDNDDLVDLNNDLPDGLIDFDGSDAENASGGEVEWAGFSGGQKRKRVGEQTDHGRKKKLSSLPTFASYENYAQMIEDGPEDDI